MCRTAWRISRLHAHLHPPDAERREERREEELNNDAGYELTCPEDHERVLAHRAFRFWDGVTHECHML